jgi:hypothetical protein
MVSERQPSLQKLRMPRRSRENVVHVAIPLQAIEDLSLFHRPTQLGKEAQCAVASAAFMISVH